MIKKNLDKKIIYKNKYNHLYEFLEEHLHPCIKNKELQKLQLSHDHQMTWWNFSNIIFLGFSVVS